jgi:hypothetical protein
MRKRKLSSVRTTSYIEPAICISDRYGEVYFSAFFADTAPSADNVLEWLRYIEIQCPECGVSEWPAAA